MKGARECEMREELVRVVSTAIPTAPQTEKMKLIVRSDTDHGLRARLCDPHKKWYEYYFPVPAIDNPASIQLLRASVLPTNRTVELTSILSAIKVCARYVADLITLTQFDVSENLASGSSDETNEEILSCNPNTRSAVEKVKSQIAAKSINKFSDDRGFRCPSVQSRPCIQ